LGDVLWIEPVVRQLAAKYRKVVVYTKYPELFANYPLPNVVVKKELSILEKIVWRLERFLHVRFFFIDLENAYEKEPRAHFLLAYQHKAGLPAKEEYPRLYLSDQERVYRPVDGPYVLLHLESLADKNYRKVFGVDWSVVAQHLQARGFQPLQLGKAPPDIPGAPALKSSVRQMIAAISHASLFIGIDSGPSHIAASLGTPSLVFFGAVNPAYRHFPRLFKGRFLQQPCEFAGCYHEGKAGIQPSCRWVGDQGIPKCSLHSTEYVLNNIDLLAGEYQL
jgi:ADP-heptose:LPS heptosyltransferase